VRRPDPGGEKDRNQKALHGSRRNIEDDSFGSQGKFSLELVVSDKREILADYIEVPIVLKLGYGLENGPGSLDKFF